MLNTLLSTISELTPASIVVLFVMGLVFLAVVTATLAFLEKQERDKRIDLVANEREQLREIHRRELKNQKPARLRDKPRGILPQLVEKLNLREVFDAETTRSQLRMAGYRLESHLLTFLVIRLISPFALALFAYLYSGIVISGQNETRSALIAALAGFGIGYMLPMILLKNMIQRRQQSIRDAWSDALDLLLICVESGQSMEQALQRVSVEISSQSRPLAEELQLTVAELSFLNDRRKALENLAERTGLPTVKSVVTAMIQSEKYGTPLSQALRALAKENREERMQEIEKKAAALPPKLTVVLVICFLPVIGIILMTPAYVEWKQMG